MPLLHVIRTLVAIISLLTLVGCQMILDIVVDDEHSLHPHFSFYYALRPHLSILSVPVRLGGFAVSRTGNNSPDVVVWEIAAIIGKPDVTLKTLEYGVTPEGFRTVVPAAPLEWNNTYRASAGLGVAGDQSVDGAIGVFRPTDNSDKSPHLDRQKR